MFLNVTIFVSNLPGLSKRNTASDSTVRWDQYGSVISWQLRSLSYPPHTSLAWCIAVFHCARQTGRSCNSRPIISPDRLPPIQRGDFYWCTLYRESDAEEEKLKGYVWKRSGSIAARFHIDLKGTVSVWYATIISRRAPESARVARWSHKGGLKSLKRKVFVKKVHSQLNEFLCI